MTPWPASKLGLGSAQFGLDYGATNLAGRTPPADVIEILQHAHRAGLYAIDTAPAYGGSEEVLGASLPKHHNLRLVTKTPVFGGSVITRDDAATLTKSLLHSLRVLRQPNLYGLLIHDAENLLRAGGERLFAAMEDLRDRGQVTRIGVSVYRATQIDAVLERFGADIIQAPLNVFDQRLVESGHVEALARSGVELHTRSSLLQGLLMSDATRLPDYFSPIRGLIMDFQNRCKNNGISRMAAALGFCVNRPEVACVLVGVCSAKELGQVLAASYEDIPASFDYSRFRCEDEAMIDPSRWPMTARMKPFS